MNLFPLSRKSVIASVAIALTGILVGLILPQEIRKPLIHFMEESLSQIPFNPLGIFLNNFRAALVMLLGGILLGLPGGIAVFFNFVVLGAVTMMAVDGGFLPLYLASILPHGVLELPAVVISAACGFALAGDLIRFLRKEEKDIVGVLKKKAIFFGGIIVPVLAVAALIETLVTPWVAKFFK